MPTLTLSAASDSGGSFALDLGPDLVRLLNPDGNVVAMFARADARTKIVLPSKSPPRETLGVRDDSNSLVDLRATPEALEALCAYLGTRHVDVEEQDAAAHPVGSPTTSVSPARSYTRDLSIGATILLVGLALGIVGILEIGRGLLGWLLVGAGALVALIGLGWIVEAQRSRQRVEESQRSL